ncbi:ABC transporter substrate-binding protein [Paracoccus sp. TK19116]|uniref:ABC transporter substrate-binding protein n=1 Tax=Paracoccus albicereus TaxID=2922394 RepID=A0ABT1MW90_9RHOB|nr:ABC transporter substrate-binding protein [Paracoccus albicereus]MCQ0971781.1 ABC transporter substrate-binding protein [Paracoccus albicereus]
MTIRLTVAALLALATPAAADPHPEAQRILSIGGSVTEIVYALGQQDRLIARDTTSSFPAEAQSLPDVGYMRALSPEGVLSVRPDLILSEDGAGPPETIAVLRQADIPFETIPAGTNADGLAAKIEAVANALGVPDAAKAPVADLRADLAALDASALDGDRKRVLFILSLQGGRVMASGTGTAADAMIRLAKADNAIAAFEGYKPLTDEAITAAAPDVIVMMDRGEATGSHDAAYADLLAMPAISTTPAAKAGAVIRMDGLYLLGFGPRTGQAARDLHRAIYGSGHGGA